MHASALGTFVGRRLGAYWRVDAETGGSGRGVTEWWASGGEVGFCVNSLRNTGLRTIPRAVLRICIHIHIPHTFRCIMVKGRGYRREECIGYRSEVRFVP